MLRAFDQETLREVFVYLYRCWLQQYLGELPVKLGVSENDGVLEGSRYSLFYSVGSVGEEVAADLSGRLAGPLYLFAPSFPSRMTGVTSFAPQGKLGHPLDDILGIVARHWEWLQEHRERALSRSEAYELADHGTFAVWRSTSATRLLLTPQSGETYGYAVLKNGPNDYFLRRSRSCKEDGRKVASGVYKRTNHRQESKSFVNFDLISDGEGPLLLHLINVGAGYKAFPRQVPAPHLDVF